VRSPFLVVHGVDPKFLLSLPSPLPTAGCSRSWPLATGTTKAPTNPTAKQPSAINTSVPGSAALKTPGTCRATSTLPPIVCRGEHALIRRNRKFVDSPLEGTGFELPVRGRGQCGCRPFYAAECSGRVGAPFQFPDRQARRPASKPRGPDRRGRNPCRRRTAPDFAWSGKKTATLYRVDRTRRSRPGARQPSAI